MTETPVRRAAARSDFHRLTVKRVERADRRLRRDHPHGARRPGRRVRVRRRADADRPPRRGTAHVLDLRPGRVLPRGSASARSPAARSPAGSCTTLKAGDTLEVQAPSGTFTPDLSVPGRHVLIAAGSGITPMMSIAASVLAADDKSTVTLLYGNRRSDTVMFADEVADLKDAHPARMQIVHVLSREPQEVELHSGRLDAARLTALLPATVDVPAVDHWWLCGPFAMVTDAIEVLRELGVDARPHPPRAVLGRRRAACRGDPRRRSRRRGRQPDRRPRRAQHHAHPARGHADPRRRPAGQARPAVRLQGRRLRHLPGQGHQRRGGHAPQLRPRAARDRRRLRPDLPGTAADRGNHR